ncbi:hypothetical protein ACFYPX_11160 [Micromonospora zamorensis]|uniref:hypothetical protein n=1 Tax=Micromonospora zamorensis TaxID=709883 RepID=UPI0036B7CA13
MSTAIERRSGFTINFLLGMATEAIAVCVKGESIADAELGQLEAMWMTVSGY